MRFFSIREIFFFHAHLLFTGLDDNLSRLEQVQERPSRAVNQLGDTSDKSGDESDRVEPRRRMLSKRTHKMKNAWGASDVGQFFCDWFHRCYDTAQPFLLPYLSQSRLYADTWSPRNFATLPRHQAFSARPTAEVGDAKLGSAGLWGKCHKSCRSGATAGENNEGFGRERQGAAFFTRSSLLTILVQWTQILGLRPKFLPLSKFWVWAEDMNWCTSSVGSLLCLLSQSTWMLRGHATRSWLVFPFVPYCLRSLCAFSLLRVVVYVVCVHSVCCVL